MRQIRANMKQDKPEALRVIDEERTHHQLVLVLSVNLWCHVQSEIDHEQELQLEAVHLCGRYTSHLRRQLQNQGRTVRKACFLSTPSEEPFMPFTP